MVDVSKRDWKLFREKLPGWQESYMERLCKEYVELLTCEKRVLNDSGHWKSVSKKIAKLLALFYRSVNLIC